jgi:putative MATE family efflux protein
MLAQAFVAIAETFYAGMLGTTQLAALALTFPFVMLQQMMSAGAMGGGISSAISRALGAGDHTRANALASHALVIGVLAGLAATALMLVFGPRLYAALGGRGTALAEAVAYSNIIFSGILAIWLTNTLASILRGTGNMRAPSLALLSGSLLHVTLAGVLALGVGPFPRLGMVGLALGQLIAFLIVAIILAIILWRGQQEVKLDLAAFRIDRAMFADILKVGAIAVISPIQSVATVLILTRFVSTFGTEAIAGYGIGARLEFMLVPIVFAVGVASVPMVGMAIGARNVPRARRVAWTAGLIAAAVTGAIGLTVALLPDLWARLYTQDADVLAVARTYLRAAGLAFAFYGFGLAIYFASQGSGRILGPVLAQSVRLAVVAIGGSWVMASGYGVDALIGVVAAAMIAYGLATAASLQLAKWG